MRAQLHFEVSEEETHRRALDCFLRHAKHDLPLTYPHLRVSWLYESSPYVRNLTKAKYHIERAHEEAEPHEALVLLWIRVRLQVRAFLDTIHHRDWKRAFL